MIQQEIQERNEAIATMLADYNTKTQRFVFRTKLFNSITYCISKLHHKKQLCFDSNWNWLMMAVEFISSLGGRYLINNESCAISINEPYWYSQEVIVEENKLLRAVFIAVSDFADFYNAEKL